MMQFTASVQRELGRGWQAQADYIGNRTSHNSYSLPLDDDVYIPGGSTTSNDAARFSLTLANPTWGPYYAGGDRFSLARARGHAMAIAPSALEGHYA